MPHVARVESEQIVDELHDDARAEGADDRPDADGTAEQPAKEQHQGPEPDFHHADGHTG